MRYVYYWGLQALRGIRLNFLIQIAATGAIAAGFLLVGLAVLGVINVENLTRHWGRGTQVIVYLKPEVPTARGEAMAELLRGRPEVLSIRHVSPEEAHRRLSESLGGRKSLLAGVEKDFLPASLELNLNPEEPASIRPLLALLSTSPLVEEVDYMGAWVERLNRLVTMLRGAALAIALVVGLACLYIISSTIRIGIYARREEIEILRLVGAGGHYIKAPFLIEGAIQGLFGVLAASLLLYLIFRLTIPRVEAVFAAALSHVEFGFLPPLWLALGLSGGALLGLLGSRMAIGKYVD